MNEREHRIRELAHELWEKEGRPPHREKHHWEQAEKLLAERDGSVPPAEQANASPKSQASPGSNKTTAPGTAKPKRSIKRSV